MPRKIKRVTLLPLVIVVVVVVVVKERAKYLSFFVKLESRKEEKPCFINLKSVFLLFEAYQS